MKKRYIPNYKAVHKGISTVDNEAYQDYRKKSKIRNPKKFNYYTDYRRVIRKIWKKIADYSIEYESGVYDSTYFYLIPQVVDNRPFFELPDGRIKTNYHTNGNIYAPLFCSLSKRFDHSCWSFDGMYTESYRKKLNEKVNKEIPEYYFILSTLLKNKL